MTSRFPLVALLAGLTLLGANLRADDSDAALNADLQRIVAAVKANDFGVAIDLMYSPVADAAGGKDAVKKMAEQAKGDMAAKGFKIITYDLIPPYQRVSTAVNDYAIIPVHIVLEMDAHQVDTNTFQLAIKAHGASKWEYLDGSGISPEMKGRYFPDLKDTSFPEVKRKVLN